jgi:hypothetical protein
MEQMTVRFDVSVDGRTWRYDQPVDAPPGRGATFLVNGKIFPAGTFDEGSTGPDSLGTIGTWVCRGVFYFDLVEWSQGKVPREVTTQYFLFDDDSMLISEGFEGGVQLARVVSGGTGAYAGARGVSTPQEVAKNSTRIKLSSSVEAAAPNLVFTFTLT